MMFLSLANLAKDAMNVYKSAKKAPNKYFNNQPGNYGYPNQPQYNGYPNQQQYNGYPNQQNNGYPNQHYSVYPNQQHSHLDSMQQEYNSYMDQPPIESYQNQFSGHLNQNPQAHPYQMHYGGHPGIPPQTNNLYNLSPYKNPNIPPYNMRENENSKLHKQYISGSLKYRDAHEYYINKIKKFLFKKI